MNQHTRMGALVLALAFALPAMAALRPAAAEAAVPANGESFATPEAAVAALIDTLRRGDQAAIAATLGPGTDKLLSSGDAAADAEARRRFLAAYDEKHALVGRPGSDGLAGRRERLAAAAAARQDRR